MDYSIFILIGRVLFGGFFLVNAFMHFSKSAALAQYAASKKVPAPRAMVLATGGLMAVGGVGVILGIFISLAVACLVVFLLTAAFKFHDFWAVTDPMQKQMQMILFMRNIALTGAALMALGLFA